MAVAEITFDYGQVLALARQLPLNDRKRLSVDVLSETQPNSFASWISCVAADSDITEEEILSECDAVRNELYSEAS